MKVIRRINEHFLAEEGQEIHWSDFAWFYGGYGTVGIIVLFTALSI